MALEEEELRKDEREIEGFRRAVWEWEVEEQGGERKEISAVAIAAGDEMSTAEGEKSGSN